MSVSGALFNALSGLSASSRAVEVISTNVANSMTDGFGRRELELSSRTLAGEGSGVRVDGVRRVVDQAVLKDLRSADAQTDGNHTRLSFYTRMQDMFGQPDDPASMSSRIAQMQAALVEASSRPDSSARLSSVVDSVKGIAGHLNQTTDEIQSARMEADQGIGSIVTQLNADLQRVSELNHSIRQMAGSNRDAGGLIDQRQKLIDQISSIIPVREVSREFGQVALFTPGGAILLEGRPAELVFTPVSVITPDMTRSGGALSGLTLNGNPIANLGNGGPIAGGRLQALFDVRDTLAVDAQERVDAIAKDLIDRFADPALDPTIAVGSPGLFTDAGGAFTSGDEVGLAGRISINAMIDPAAGGETWRLRAGLYAAAPNDAGDGGLLVAMADRLALARDPVSGPFAGVARSAGALSGEFAALWGAEAQSLEKDLSYSASRSDTLRALHLQDGVDTDHEMQKLLMVEQAYAANARVVSTIDDLIKTLLGL